jgi:hypothetical protein
MTFVIKLANDQNFHKKLCSKDVGLVKFFKKKRVLKYCQNSVCNFSLTIISSTCAPLGHRPF